METQLKLTAAQHVRKTEAAIKAKGGRRMPSGMLQPAAAKALADLLEAKYAASPVAVIVAALFDAQKKVKRSVNNH